MGRRKTMNKNDEGLLDDEIEEMTLID